MSKLESYDEFEGMGCERASGPVSLEFPMCARFSLISSIASFMFEPCVQLSSTFSQPRRTSSTRGDCSKPSTSLHSSASSYFYGLLRVSRSVADVLSDACFFPYAPGSLAVLRSVLL